MSRALLVPADLSEPTVESELGDGIATIQNLVGGTFEEVVLPVPTRGLFAHDEAKLTAAPVNLRATVLWRHDWLQHADGELDPNLLAAETIHGDVLVVGPADEHGRTRDLPGSDLEELQALFSRLS